HSSLNRFINAVLNKNFSLPATKNHNTLETSMACLPEGTTIIISYLFRENPFLLFKESNLIHR
ncbi:MAG: hypothetical protein PUP92_39685, partial [Rhizonema sp. PD38]|nr:hypothetical protein [Rhizonema sp. PD38]